MNERNNASDRLTEPVGGWRADPDADPDADPAAEPAAGPATGPATEPVLHVAQLRLAAGLTAAIPGAELRAGCGGEDTGAGAPGDLVVGDHPAADISPATMRCVAIETLRRCRSRVDTVATVPNLGELRLGGSIEDLGGGVLRVVTRSGVEQRWLATIIPPDELAELLRSVGCHELSADQSDPVHARVVPDSQLAVAMVEITVDPGAPIGMLDRVAADAAARCYVAELLRTL